MLSTASRWPYLSDDNSDWISPSTARGGKQVLSNACLHYCPVLHAGPRVMASRLGQGSHLTQKPLLLCTITYFFLLHPYQKSSLNSIWLAVILSPIWCDMSDKGNWFKTTYRHSVGLQLWSARLHPSLSFQTCTVLHTCHLLHVASELWKGVCKKGKHALNINSVTVCYKKNKTKQNGTQ